MFTGIMGDKLYKHLEEENLLPDEQKGYRRHSRGTKDQLLIDKLVIRNCKRRKTGLVTFGWITKRRTIWFRTHGSSSVYESLELLKIWSCCWKKYESMASRIICRKTHLWVNKSKERNYCCLAFIPLSMVLRRLKLVMTWQVERDF